MTKSTPSKISWARIFLGIAVLFSLVGAGNLIVGHSRAMEYARDLSKAEHRRTTRNPSTSQTNQPTEEFREITGRIKSRIDFYQLVEQGGKGFLALGALFFLLAAISIRPRPDELPVQPDQS